MPKFSQRQRYTLAVLCSLLIAGLVLLSFPAPAEQNIATYSTPTNYSASALQTVIGYALSGYYASAHITTGNAATVTLTLVETDLVIFTSTFSRGNIRHSKHAYHRGQRRNSVLDRNIPGLHADERSGKNIPHSHSPSILLGRSKDIGLDRPPNTSNLLPAHHSRKTREKNPTCGKSRTRPALSAVTSSMKPD